MPIQKPNIEMTLNIKHQAGGYLIFNIEYQSGRYSKFTLGDEILIIFSFNIKYQSSGYWMFKLDYQSGGYMIFKCENHPDLYSKFKP